MYYTIFCGNKFIEGDKNNEANFTVIWTISAEYVMLRSRTKLNELGHGMRMRVKFQLHDFVPARNGILSGSWKS